MKNVDLSWMSKESRTFLKDGYLLEGETAEERYDFIAEYLGEKSGIEGFAEKWKYYISKKWASFASPEIANLGREKGLPASCNFLEIQDTMESIASAEYEMTMLASNGAGTARNFSKIRPKGAKYGINGLSEGVLSWIESYATKIDKTSQGGMRRGFLTAYLSVDHEEILDFLRIGREGHHIHNITTGVTIPKGWMESLLKGDKEKQNIFKEIHASRAEVGYPYILFEDNCNIGKHQVYVDKDKWLSNSNICTECVEYTDEFKEFLCVLMSVNLEFYDEWKDTDFVFDCNLALDIITDDYIEKAKHLKGHEKAVRFAEEHRAIGVGVMGLATYFQKKMVPFGGLQSQAINKMIFKHIREESDRASKWMAKEWGEPTFLKGYGDRNTSRCVSGDTKVLTKDGHFEIKSLVGKEVDIWNGYEYSKVRPYQTGVSELYRVTLNNGKYIDCTSDHVFKVLGVQIDKSNINNKRIIDVKTKDLRVGDVLSKFRLPIIDGELFLEDAYTQGFFTGDGSISNARKDKYPRKEIRLYGSKMDCVNRIKWKSVRKCKYGDRDLIRGYIDNSYKDKYFVPINNYSIQSKLDWLAGIIDSDGSSTSKGVTITSKYKEFLIDISFMLQTLGCHSYISKIKRTGGYGREKNETSYYYGINLSFQCCTILNSLGIKTERVKVPLGIKGYNDTPMYSWVEVVDVEILNRKEMTYCFTEEKNHTGVFNGIMTGQCAIAPTKSSSAIMGFVSQGIEPIKNNYHPKDLAKIMVDWRNPQLESLLESKGHNTEEVWDSILENGGSVQHLNILDQNEKDVFKTFTEISQNEVIKLASDRQKYIDQSQSLNIIVAKGTKAKDILKLTVEAWRSGIKTLYYQYNINASREKTKEIITCSSCEA